MTFCKDNSAGQVKSLAVYFSIKEPKKADTDSLIACLQETLQALGVDVLTKTSVLDSKPILIGGGTDGASVNISGQNEMRMQQ